MKVEILKYWKDSECTECHSKKNLRELYIGENVIILCRDCRKKLQGLLNLHERVDELDEKIMKELSED